MGFVLSKYAARVAHTGEWNSSGSLSDFSLLYHWLIQGRHNDLHFKKVVFF